MRVLPSTLFLAALLTTACKRSQADSAALDGGSSETMADAAPTALPEPEDELVPEAPPDEGPRPPLSRTEPRRTTLRRVEDERLLVPHIELLRRHFGGAIPTPLELQSIEQEGQRQTILLFSRLEEPSPILLSFSATGQLLWAKERPVAGVVPSVTELALATGRRSEVVLVFYNPPTHIVAARYWDKDGAILADFVLATVESCAALSALYWPRRGLFVAAAQPNGPAHLALLDETGRLGFPREGVRLPWSSRTGAPVSLALDTEESILLFQVGDARAALPSDHLFVARYDPQGKPLWLDPIDLGTLPRLPRGRHAPRIRVSPKAPGFVRVTLPQSAARPPLEISSAGVVSAAIHP